MEIKFVNPYAAIGADFTTGMDSIASSLSMIYPNQTIDELVNAVYTTVITQYSLDPTTLQERSMKSVIYSIINGYINVGTGEYLLYNATQMNYVFELLEGTSDAKNPEDILNNIKQIEESIAVSQLSTEEQEPLLYATQIGKTAYAYWANILANSPGMYGNWNDFIVSFTPAIVKFPFWIAAAMEGTLIANSMLRQRVRGQFAAELQLVINYFGTPLLVSLAGSLAAGAGKVAFNLQQRIITSPSNELAVYNRDCGCK